MNIYQLHKLSKNYLNIGYSNTDIKIHLNKIYSMPIFYILMTILGFIIINKLKKIKSKFFVIIFGVLVSVVVYYLNYFSTILGNKGALPIYLSVWLPLLILFLICNIGVLKSMKIKKTSTLVVLVFFFMFEFICIHCRF